MKKRLTREQKLKAIKDIKGRNKDPNAVKGIRKPRETMPVRSVAEEYITANINKARNKLKYLEKKGYYKASETAQRAKAQMNFLSKKYGYGEGKFLTGKKFRNSIKSFADLSILYRLVRDLININTREAAKEYKEVKQRFEDEVGIDLDTTFDTVSMLSKDYREVFAFLSYNEVVEFAGEGDKDIRLKLFKYIEMQEKKTKLTTEQEEAYRKIKPKMLNYVIESDDVDSLYLLKLLNGNKEWG